MRIKTKSELLATGVYREFTGSMQYRHDDGSWLRDDVLGKRIEHNQGTMYKVDGSGEWHLSKDCIETKEDNVLRLLERIDALQTL